MNTEATLFVVATPIGNYADITLRALETLKHVSIIACEDTRETGLLLKEHAIVDKKLLSYHAQSGQGREDEIIRLLQEGTNIAVVSDRGTPGISDPGQRLIQRAIEHGITIAPIPGAAAFVTALQASGADTSHFEYLGFIPHKKGRQTLFTRIVESEHTMICYESPHRLLKTLEALKDCPKRLIVCREITKTHEEFVRGTCAEVYQEFLNRDKILGEFVLIIDKK